MSLPCNASYDVKELQNGLNVHLSLQPRTLMHCTLSSHRYAGLCQWLPISHFTFMQLHPWASWTLAYSSCCLHCLPKRHSASKNNVQLNRKMLQLCGSPPSHLSAPCAISHERISRSSVGLRPGWLPRQDLRLSCLRCCCRCCLHHLGSTHRLSLQWVRRRHNCRLHENICLSDAWQFLAIRHPWSMKEVA